MAIKHHNHEYDGGSPDIPLALGDRYYSQDLGRDFHYLRNLVGRILADLGQTLPALVSGGVVTKGTGDTLDITPAVGYVKHEVDLPDAFSSIPPAVIQEDIVLRAASAQQTNMAVAGATLNGSTVNYVKLRYAEANGDSRARAKKAGSYYYEQSAGFSIVVNSTANTDYDVLLATFTGTIGGPFDITQVDPELKIKDYMLDFGTGAGQVGAEDLPIEDAGGFFAASEVEAALAEIVPKASVTAGENISAGDAVGIIDGAYYKMKIREMAKEAIGGAYTIDRGDFAVKPNDPTKFIIANHDLPNDDLDVRIGEWVSGAVSWLSAWTELTAAGSVSFSIRWLTPYGTDTFVISWVESSNTYVRVGSYSGGTITWLTAATLVASTTSPGGVIGWEGAGSDGRFVVYYGSNTTAFCRVGEESAGSINWVTAALQLSANFGVNILDAPARAIEYIGDDYFMVLTKDSTAYGIWTLWGKFNGTSLTFPFNEQSLERDVGETTNEYSHRVFKLAPYKIYATWITAATGTKKYSQWFQLLDYEGITGCFGNKYGPAYGPLYRRQSAPVNTRPVTALGVLNEGFEVFPAVSEQYGLYFQHGKDGPLLHYHPAAYGIWLDEGALMVIGEHRDIVFFLGDEANDDNKYILTGFPLLAGVAVTAATLGNPLVIALPGAVVSASGKKNGLHHVNLLTGAIEQGFVTGANQYPIGRVVGEKLYIGMGA